MKANLIKKLKAINLEELYDEFSTVLKESDIPDYFKGYIQRYFDERSNSIEGIDLLECVIDFVNSLNFD